MSASIWPFLGLPVAVQIFFAVALLVILGLFVWTATLYFRGRRAVAEAPAPRDPDDFLWVFIVPALNEAVTIRDSVDRLLAIEVERRVILVVDDGSDDDTAAILARIGHPDLCVLHRVSPNAREGKAAALNYAYRELARLQETIRDRVIIAVVDADGRLSADAPRYVGAHFDDPAVAGVQSLVRIYNRSRLLTWFQHLEFAIYGRLFQAGRNRIGTAGMGGSGQFNRLSALDSIAVDGGPWRDRLTEDQDLGLRLVAAGWSCRQDLRAAVDQQGLPELGQLFRQRTRWAQGNLQAFALAGALVRAPLALPARLELLVYLLMPLWQGLVGAALLASLVLWAFGQASFWGDGPWWTLVFFYALGFGGTLFGCIAAYAHEGARGWAKGLLSSVPYALYSWLLWPVLVRASARQLTARRDWSKTQREPLPTEPDAATATPAADALLRI